MSEATIALIFGVMMGLVEAIKVLITWVKETLADRKKPKKKAEESELPCRVSETLLAEITRVITSLNQTDPRTGDPRCFSPRDYGEKVEAILTKLDTILAHANKCPVPELFVRQRKEFDMLQEKFRDKVEELLMKQVDVLRAFGVNLSSLSGGPPVGDLSDFEDERDPDDEDHTR